jgi:hypothetical protein
LCKETEEVEKEREECSVEREETPVFQNRKG